MNSILSERNISNAYNKIKTSSKKLFNIRVYFGHYIAFFKDTEISIMYNYIDGSYDLHINWNKENDLPYSFSEMNLYYVYSSNTTNFNYSDDKLSFKDNSTKIEIELN